MSVSIDQVHGRPHDQPRGPKNMPWLAIFSLSRPRSLSFPTLSKSPRLLPSVSIPTTTTLSLLCSSFPAETQCNPNSVN
jgi:hypothetical protein